MNTELSLAQLFSWLNYHRQLHPHAEWQRIMDDPERQKTWKESWLKTFTREGVTSHVLHEVSLRLHGQDLGFPEKQMVRLLSEAKIIREENQQTTQEQRRDKERRERRELQAEEDRIYAAQDKIDAMTEEQRDVLRREASLAIGSAARWELFVVRAMRIFVADGWEPPKNSNDRRHWHERRIQTTRSD